MLSYAKFATACGILSLCFVISAEEKNPTDSASDRVPDETVRGTTSDKGPTTYGKKTEKETRAESVAEPKEKETVRVGPAPATAPASAAPAPAAETKVPEATVSAPGAEPVSPTAEQIHKEREAARKRLEEESNIRAAIRRLCTSGWREAQLQLIDSGKTGIPFLIEALSNSEEDGTAAPASYQLGGHLKADLGRAPRQRTRAEVCSELLTEIVSHHSNFKGDCPTNDQKAWQEWWVANGDKVSFAK